MKKIWYIILIFTIVLFTLTGCKSNFQIETNENDGNGWYNGKENKDDNTMNEDLKKINININGKDYITTLETNEAVNELLEKLPFSITMSDLNNNEKYYYLDTSFKTNGENIGNIEIGDIMLFGNNCLVLFYDSFSTSYSYTKIGKIDDVSDLKEHVGNGTINVFISKIE